MKYEDLVLPLVSLTNDGPANQGEAWLGGIRLNIYNLSKLGLVQILLRVA